MEQFTRAVLFREFTSVPWRIENADCCGLSNPPVEVHRRLGMREEQWREICQCCAQKLGLVTSANLTQHWGLVWNHDGFVHSCQCTPIVDQWARPYCLQHSKRSQLFRHYLDVDTQRSSGDIQRCPRDIQGYLQYPEIPEKSGDIWRWCSFVIVPYRKQKWSLKEWGHWV